MVGRTVLIELRDHWLCQRLRAGDMIDRTQLIGCVVYLAAVELFATILTEQGVPFHEEFFQSSRGGRGRICRVNRCAN